MNKLIFLVITGLFLLGNSYIGRKYLLIIQQVSSFNHTILFWLLLYLLAFASIATLLLAKKNVSGLVGKIGSYWLSIWCVSLVMFSLTDIGLIAFGKVIGLSERISVFVWLLSLVTVIALCLYGTWQAQQIRTAAYQVTLKASTIEKKQQIKAVLISDVHLGYVNDVDKLKKIVTKINQMKPDIVFIAGDLFDGNYEALQDPDGMKQQFQRLSSKYGTYMCWGNHDAGETFSKMKQMVKASNIVLLEDEWTIIDDSFVIVGRKDSQPIGSQEGKRQSFEEEMKKIGVQLPKIILDHQPSNLDEYKEQNELILSGHTHKGQIFPFSIVTKAYFTVDYGYYRMNKTSPQVIVSSGIGTWGPPMRLGTQSELVQIDLTIE